MSLRRLRRGELLVILALLGLVATLFLEWFSLDVDFPGASGEGSASAILGVDVDDGTETGWGVLGHPWIELLLLTGISWLAVLGTAVRSGPGRPEYGALVALVVAVFLTFLTLVLTAIRTLLATPGPLGLGDATRVGSGDAATTIALSSGAGTWVGLASLAVGLLGLWLALADDRTDSPDNEVVLPPARPVPPHRADDAAAGSVAD